MDVFCFGKSRSCATDGAAAITGDNFKFRQSQWHTIHGYYMQRNYIRVITINMAYADTQ